MSTRVKEIAFAWPPTMNGPIYEFTPLQVATSQQQQQPMVVFAGMNPIHNEHSELMMVKSTNTTTGSAGSQEDQRHSDTHIYYGEKSFSASNTHNQLGLSLQQQNVHHSSVAAAPPSRELNVPLLGVAMNNSSSSLSKSNVAATSNFNFSPITTTSSSSNANGSLMSPLSSGGFIFNYPPMYSETPIPPFSRPVQVTASAAAIHQVPVNTNTSPSSSYANSIPSSPSSPATSPLSDSCVISSPGSPMSPHFTNGAAPHSRKEKLEKYRQKRTKRNYNRHADPSRRERAQSRTRDELGQFLSGPKKEDQVKMQFQMEDVRNKLEVWMRESQALKDKLNEVESKLEEQQKINTQLLHENRILWSTVTPSDVFNTVRPGATYSDAFKEKVDLTNIELNWTDSPYLGTLKLDNNNTNDDDIETTQWSLDVPNLDLSAGSLS